jgi:hypothetical protein
MKTINTAILLILALAIISCAGEETKQVAAIAETPKTDTTALVSDAQKEVQEVKKEAAKPSKKKLADIFVYSKSGTLMEKIVYTIKNGKHIKNVYKFNADGRKIAWDKYNEKGVLEETVVFKEDVSVAKKKDDVKQKDAPYKFAFKYNEQGKRTEWKSFNDDGSVGHSFTYKYDEQGREIEWKSMGSNGQVEGTNNYLYDDKGRKSEWQHFNEKNEMDYKYIYSYDDNGKQSAKLVQIAANDKLFVDKEVK